MADGRIWTLRRNGKELLSFTSFIETKATVNSNIMTEMVAPGNFSSYDRAISPSTFSVQLAKEGTDSELHRVHIVLERLRKGTEIFSIVTPDYEFKNLCLQGYSYKRDNKNAKGFVIVDLDIAEIKMAPNSTASYSADAVRQEKEPSCSKQTDTGLTNTKKAEDETRDKLAQAEITQLLLKFYDNNKKLDANAVRMMSQNEFNQMYLRRGTLLNTQGENTVYEEVLMNMYTEIVVQWKYLHSSK